MPRRGGPCQAPMDDNEGGICGYEGLSSTWYGRRGNQFCGSHRAAWLKWRRDEGNYDDHEDPSCLTSIGEILGARYCEPSKMATPAKYNDVSKNCLEFCVQGIFTVPGYTCGYKDTRWQTIDEMVESCSREDFDKVTKAYVKDIQATFKRSTKRFKTQEQRENEG